MLNYIYYNYKNSYRYMNRNTIKFVLDFLFLMFIYPKDLSKVLFFTDNQVVVTLLPVFIVKYV